MRVGEQASVKSIACLCEVYELVELEGLVATGGCHGSGHIELTRNLGYECWIAVVFAIPAPHITTKNARGHDRSRYRTEMYINTHPCNMQTEATLCFHPCSVLVSSTTMP